MHDQASAPPRVSSSPMQGRAVAAPFNQPEPRYMGGYGVYLPQYAVPTMQMQPPAQPFMPVQVAQPAACCMPTVHALGALSAGESESAARMHGCNRVDAGPNQVVAPGGVGAASMGVVPSSGAAPAQLRMNYVPHGSGGQRTEASPACSRAASHCFPPLDSGARADGACLVQGVVRASAPAFGAGRRAGCAAMGAGTSKLGSVMCRTDRGRDGSRGFGKSGGSDGGRDGARRGQDGGRESARHGVREGLVERAREVARETPSSLSGAPPRRPPNSSCATVFEDEASILAPFDTKPGKMRVSSAPHAPQAPQGEPASPPGGCRRDKSLSALANELIAKYGAAGQELDLDEVQAAFPTWKKRRLYDVMCVCQCLRVVVRQGKAQFIWRGISQVQDAVRDILLRNEAGFHHPLSQGRPGLKARRGSFDREEPSVPITGLAFLCQQFVLLLREREQKDLPTAIGLEDATSQLCHRVGSNDHKTVLRRLYDVINVLEALELLARPSGLRRSVAWCGPSLLVDVPKLQPGAALPSWPGVAIAGRKRKRIEARDAPRRRRARTRSPLKRALEELEAQIDWQPTQIFTTIWLLSRAFEGVEGGPRVAAARVHMLAMRQMLLGSSEGEDESAPAARLASRMQDCSDADDALACVVELTRLVRLQRDELEEEESGRVSTAANDEPRTRPKESMSSRGEPGLPPYWALPAAARQVGAARVNEAVRELSIGSTDALREAAEILLKTQPDDDIKKACAMLKHANEDAGKPPTEPAADQSGAPAIAHAHTQGGGDAHRQALREAVEAESALDLGSVCSGSSALSVLAALTTKPEVRCPAADTRIDARSDSARIDYTGGDNTRGDNTRGDNTRGDNTRGDNTRGDNTRGDNTRGDNTRGDNTRGDNTRGDNTRGDNARLDAMDAVLHVRPWREAAPEMLMKPLYAPASASSMMQLLPPPIVSMQPPLLRPAFAASPAHAPSAEPIQLLRMQPNLPTQPPRGADASANGTRHRNGGSSAADIAAQHQQHQQQRYQQKQKQKQQQQQQQKQQKQQRHPHTQQHAQQRSPGDEHALFRHTNPQMSPVQCFQTARQQVQPMYLPLQQQLLIQQQYHDQRQQLQHQMHHQQQLMMVQQQRQRQQEDQQLQQLRQQQPSQHQPNQQMQLQAAMARGMLPPMASAVPKLSPTSVSSWMTCTRPASDYGCAHGCVPPCSGAMLSMPAFGSPAVASPLACAAPTSEPPKPTCAPPASASLFAPPAPSQHAACAAKPAQPPVNLSMLLSVLSYQQQLIGHADKSFAVDRVSQRFQQGETSYQQAMDDLQHIVGRDALMTALRAMMHANGAEATADAPVASTAPVAAPSPPLPTPARTS